MIKISIQDTFSNISLEQASLIFWGLIGLITFILDSLKILKLSYLTFSGIFCATTTNMPCTVDVIEGLIKFAVDLLLGPAYLAVFLTQFGLVGSILAIIVLVFAYGPTANKTKKMIK